MATGQPSPGAPTIRSAGAAEHLDAEKIGIYAERGSGPRQFLHQHHPVQPGQPAPAILRPPGDAEEAAPVQHLPPLRREPLRVASPGDGADARPAGRQLFGQHSPHLGPEGLRLGGIADIHAGSPQFWCGD
jgi:hypothetical protein